MIFDLPQSIDLSGKEFEIRTDYRVILDILSIFEDPNFSNEEKQYMCLKILYVDFDDMPTEYYTEAAKKAAEFIDNGISGDGASPRTMDWEQDAPILFPAINKAAGYEVRAVEYLHWWTFTGFFMEIKNSIFATVLNLRQKKSKGKKLENWEKDFWRDNKKICVLQPRLTDAEKQEKDRLNKLLL